MKKTPERKALEHLVETCEDCLVALDALMVQPSTHKRGQDVAKVLNHLSMQVDRTRYGVLGVDFRQDVPMKDRLIQRRQRRQARCKG